MAKVVDTPEYDPRYDRAQTISGAKARYADIDLDYGIADLERDVERILESGENPDRGKPWLGRFGCNHSYGEGS